MLTLLNTKRFILRPIQLIDFFYFYKRIHTDPDVMRYSFKKDIYTIKESLSFTGRSKKLFKKYGFGLFTIIDKTSKQKLGYAGIFWLKFGPEFGFKIEQKHWNKGVATEVSKTLLPLALKACPSPIVSVVEPDNIASQRVVQKIGGKKIDAKQLYNRLFWIYSYS